MSRNPRVREDLTVTVLDGEAVIYDDVSGDVHHLNPTATIVFELLDGSGSLDDLAADIADAYGLEPADALAQITVLVNDLADLGLLEGSEVVGG